MWRLGHSVKPSWCFAVRISPFIPASLRDAHPLRHVQRRRVERGLGLVAVSPLPIRERVDAEVDEAVELELVPRELPRRRHCAGGAGGATVAWGARSAPETARTSSVRSHMRANDTLAGDARRDRRRPRDWQEHAGPPARRPVPQRLLRRRREGRLGPARPRRHRGRPQRRRRDRVFRPALRRELPRRGRRTTAPAR